MIATRADGCPYSHVTDGGRVLCAGAFFGRDCQSPALDEEHIDDTDICEDCDRRHAGPCALDGGAS